MVVARRERELSGERGWYRSARPLAGGMRGDEVGVFRKGVVYNAPTFGGWPPGFAAAVRTGRKRMGDRAAQTPRSTSHSLLPLDFACRFQAGDMEATHVRHICLCRAAG